MLDLKGITALVKATLETMKMTLQTEIASDSPAVIEMGTEYAKGAEERVSHLAEGALSGDLSYKFVVERLKEEATILKNEILSIGLVLATDIDQLAAKTVLILEEALKDAINQAQAK